jgi:hypothetical protein
MFWRSHKAAKLAGDPWERKAAFAKRHREPQCGVYRMTGAQRYCVYGLVVESDLPLSSVDRAADAGIDPGAEATIRIVRGAPDDFRAVPQDGASEPDERIRHSVLADGAIHVKIEGVFETIVSPDGRRAVFQPLGAVDERSLEANLLNFVVGVALTLQGEEPLHATVVDLGGHAVGLLGASGAGKSTLAACFIGQGAELLTDDMLRLTFVDGKALAYPGPYRLKLFDEPALRLLPDARKRGAFNGISGKYMVQPRETIESPRLPRPLSALFWLGNPQTAPAPNGVTLKKLGGAELARNLIASGINSRYHQPDRLVRQFRFAERIAHSLPVYGLGYPREFEIMPQVLEEIRQAARP